jgi:hypothetical protein
MENIKRLDWIAVLSSLCVWTSASDFIVTKPTTEFGWRWKRIEKGITHNLAIGINFHSVQYIVNLIMST